MMNTFDLQSLPIIFNLNELVLGEIVYSRKYGVGEVQRFYNEEVVVEFPSGVKRIAVDDHELSKIPKEYFNKKIGKAQYTSEEEVNILQYGRLVGVSKRKIREEKTKYVSLEEASKIIGISRENLEVDIKNNNIYVVTVGKVSMIHRDDFLKLVKAR